jgi:hypothetical protein
VHEYIHHFEQLLMAFQKLSAFFGEKNFFPCIPDWIKVIKGENEFQKGIISE